MEQSRMQPGRSRVGIQAGAGARRHRQTIGGLIMHRGSMSLIRFALRAALPIAASAALAAAEAAQATAPADSAPADGSPLPPLTVRADRLHVEQDWRHGHPGGPPALLLQVDMSIDHPEGWRVLGLSALTLTELRTATGETLHPMADPPSDCNSWKCQSPLLFPPGTRPRPFTCQAFLTSPRMPTGQAQAIAGTATVLLTRIADLRSRSVAIVPDPQKRAEIAYPHGSDTIGFQLYPGEGLVLWFHRPQLAMVAGLHFFATDRTELPYQSMGSDHGDQEEDLRLPRDPASATVDFYTGARVVTIDFTGAHLPIGPLADHAALTITQVQERTPLDQDTLAAQAQRWP
jgi:hypothetical protein